MNMVTIYMEIVRAVRSINRRGSNFKHDHIAVHVTNFGSDDHRLKT